MKKRMRNKYQKEVNEVIDKHAKVFNHHVSNLFQRMLNDMWKLNRKYFDMKMEEIYDTS